jgi:nicotinate-nucleotide adenylyltransferase
LGALGILGGTFDPVHCGHLRLALEMRERLGLDSVALMPAGRPRLRGEPVAGADLRLVMLEAAVAPITGLVVDGRELDRTGPSRTVDTLRALRREMPTRPLCFILGLDAFAKIGQWHGRDEILDLAHLLIARRPGARLPRQGLAARLLAARRPCDRESVRERPAGFVHLERIPQMDISATDLRRRLAAGGSVDCLIPGAVRALIRENGLYANGQ